VQISNGTASENTANVLSLKDRGGTGVLLGGPVGVMAWDLLIQSLIKGEFG